MKYVSPITGREVSKKQYFEIMFGKDFIQSNNKGTLIEYNYEK